MVAVCVRVWVEVGVSVSFRGVSVKVEDTGKVIKAVIPH
jgi:hypothetical protein